MRRSLLFRVAISPMTAIAERSQSEHTGVRFREDSEPNAMRLGWVEAAFLSVLQEGRCPKMSRRPNAARSGNAHNQPDRGC